MLSIRDLEVSYGDYQVIRGVSMEVHVGEIVALLGPNGAGKSTILNSISGLQSAQAGVIEFDGVHIESMPSHKIVRLRLAHILERRRVFPYLTVYQNLWLGGYNPTVRHERKRNLERVYELFPKLRERETQLAHSMSGGEQQMLALGRGLMADPKLLMVDEPLLGLAPSVARHTIEVLKQINQKGVTILFIEQNVQTAMSLAHRGYVLESGKVVIEGTSSELLNSGEIKRVFLGGWPAQDKHRIDRLRDHGIWISAVSDVRMRAVAHLDVSRDDVTKAADKLAESLVAELAGLVQGIVQAVTARTIR